jgi:hypothetical protein
MLRRRAALIRKADYSEVNGRIWAYSLLDWRVLIDTTRWRGAEEASPTNERELKGDLCVLHPDRKQFTSPSFRKYAFSDPERSSTRALLGD